MKKLLSPRSVRFLAIAVSLWALAGCVQQAHLPLLPATAHHAGRHELRLVSVEASVNHLNVVLVIDSAARISVLNSAHHSFCNGNEDRPEGSCYEDSRGLQYIAETIRLGSARAKNVALLEKDLSRLEAASGMRIDGILGANVLNLFAYELSFSSNRLSISPPRTLEPDASSNVYLQDGWVGVPARLSDRGITMLLDSGATYSRVDANTAEAVLQSAGAQRRSLERPRGYVDLEGAIHEFDTAIRIDEFQIGDCSLTDVELLIADRNLLGLDLLSQCDTTVDAQQKRARITALERHP